jgi:prepilin peptidase CpaA
MPPILATALALLLPALVLTAAMSDATTFRIPNWISLALIAAFPVAALAAGLPLSTLGLHLGVGAAALALGMAMFALRWMGGGDAKLFSAVALWMGWPAVLTFLSAAAIAGGVLAALLLALRSAAVRPMVLTGPRWVARLAEPGEAVPYGVAIAIGALFALGASPFAGVLGL